jgi:hypothetical protein
VARMTNSLESSSGLSRIVPVGTVEPPTVTSTSRQSFSVARPLANGGEFVASAGKKEKGRLVEATFVVQRLCLLGALFDCLRHLSN